MTDNEIFDRIARDVVDVENGMFDGRGPTIWMTKDLFDRLLPEQTVFKKDWAMATLFGCRVRVVLLPGGGMRWIVGYEGTAEEDK